MAQEERERLTLDVRSVELRPPREGYHPVKLVTDRGDIQLRYYRVEGARRAAAFVGGVGGGWDTPAGGLYPRLCRDSPADSIAGLQVRFRRPAYLAECVLDLLGGLDYLGQDGIASLALVGHSFGGAVVIQAAANRPSVRTVVTLATQGYGTWPVTGLSPRCSVLLIHGTADRVLTPANSEYVHGLAAEPRLLILYPGACHGLDEVAEEVHGVVRAWIVRELAPPPA